MYKIHPKGRQKIAPAATVFLGVGLAVRLNKLSFIS